MKADLLVHGNVIAFQEEIKIQQNMSDNLNQ